MLIVFFRQLLVPEAVLFVDQVATKRTTLTSGAIEEKWACVAAAAALAFP